MNKGWSSFMERRVKERLVGASILVVLIVLIVPELLSGPKRAPSVAPAPPAGATEPVRSVIIDLATSKATAATDDGGASAAPSSEAPPDTFPADATTPGVTTPAAMARGTTPPGAMAPGATPGGAATSATATSGGSPAAPSISTLQAQHPSTAPAAVARDSTVSENVHHGWAAQLGSFAARANAEKLERQLRGQGFAASVSSSGTGRTLRYRVRVGPMADRVAAEKVVLKLKRAGHSATVVAA